MKSKQAYKMYVIEARSCELKDGGFSAEFSRVALSRQRIGDIEETRLLQFCVQND
jgi:hypothetical protein